MKLDLRLGLLALALCLPSVAMADPKDDARRHFTAGLAAAQAGDYEVALQHFLAAQDAYPHPSTLFNIARAYYDLGDLPNALTYFRLFQDAQPRQVGLGPARPLVETRHAASIARPRWPDRLTAVDVGPPRPAPGTAVGAGAVDAGAAA